MSSPIAPVAPADHGYLVKKGIQAHGVRVAEDGRLAVPMYADGKLQSIQYIAEEGGKRFLSGGRVSGCYYPIGKPDGVLIIGVLNNALQLLSLGDYYQMVCLLYTSRCV